MNPPAPGIVIDGRATRVIDGDTIEVEFVVRHRVRILDCWAPETRTRNKQEKERGIAARQRTADLLKKVTGRVRVFIPGHADLREMSTLSRVLGRVWRLFEGKPERTELAEILISEGHATKVKVGGLYIYDCITNTVF